MTKQDFIGQHLDNNKKLKNCKLPYIAYLNLLSKTEKQAERKWNKLNKQK